MSKQKLDVKKYFLSCEACYHLHRKCDPEEERPCKHCTKTKRECVTRDRKKRTKVGSKGEVNLSEIDFLRQENERLRKIIAEKEDKEKVMATNVSPTNSISRQDNFWMITKFLVPKMGEFVTPKDVQVIRMSQSMQDLLGFKLQPHSNNTLGSIVPHEVLCRGPGGDCTVEKYDKYKTLEFEVYKANIAMNQSDGQILGTSFTFTTFYEEHSMVSFFQVDNLWKINNVKEAMELMEKCPPVLVSSKLKQSSEISSSFISLNFDFLGDEDTTNKSSQGKGEKFILKEFEFDLNSLY